MDARTALAALLITAITAPAPQLLAIHKLATTLTPPPATLEVYINNKLTYAQADPPTLNFPVFLLMPILQGDQYNAILVDTQLNNYTGIPYYYYLKPSERVEDRFHVYLATTQLSYTSKYYTKPDNTVDMLVTNLTVYVDVEETPSGPIYGNQIHVSIVASTVFNKNTTIYGAILTVGQSAIGHEFVISVDEFNTPINVKDGDYITIVYRYNIG